jgi:hypothetical protein
VSPALPANAGDTAAVDFETFYDVKAKYSLTNMSVWEYLHDPRFDAYHVGIHAKDLHYSGPVTTAPWDKLVGRPLCSHNAAFDNAILTLLQHEARQIPDLRTPMMYDTIDAVRYFQEPAALGRAVKSILNIDHDKGFRSVMDGKHLADLDSDQVKQLHVYGGNDADYCWRLWEHTSPIWPVHEQLISALNRERGVEGLYLDKDALKAAIETLELAHFHLLQAMPWYPDRKPMSPEALREQGRKDGIPVPASLKMDNVIAILWENTYSKTHRWVAAVRGFRRVNSQLKKMQTWYAALRPDGTAPFSLKYFGAAATGRFSGSGGFNLQNLSKKPIVICRECWQCNMEDLDEDSVISDDYEIDSPCQICGSEKRFVIDVRGMIMAPPGRKLVIADYAQIEARLLLWQAGDKGMLARIRGGAHIYEAYAREHMGWNKGKLKDEDKTLYALSKALVLGCGYQCGPTGFVRAAKSLTGGKLIFTEEEALPHVQAYRAANQKIVDYWAWHQKWLANSAVMRDSVHEVVLASGRHVRYFNPTASTDKKTGRQAYSAEIIKGDPKMRRWFFGGKLTENEMQATGRDVMCCGVLDVEPLGIRTHFTVHDELVTSVPADQAEDAKETLERRLPVAAPWALECPLGVEVVISDRYRK